MVQHKPMLCSRHRLSFGIYSFKQDAVLQAKLWHLVVREKGQRAGESEYNDLQNVSQLRNYLQHMKLGDLSKDSYRNFQIVEIWTLLARKREWDNHGESGIKGGDAES